jgi:hypothetical protein
MFDATALASALSGLVGFRPDPAGLVGLPPALLESRSGLYVQDVSELLVLDVLQHIAPRAETLPDWLTRLQSDALGRFVPALVNAQQLSGKVLLPETPVVKNQGNRANTVNKQGRFVGIQFRPARRRGIAYTIPALTLHLDGVQLTPLTLYLYSDAQPEPVATWEVPVGNKAGFVYAFTPPATVLPQGKTWLGYYEADLSDGVRAIEAPVASCGCTDDPYKRVAESLGAAPRGCYVPVASLDADRALFDTAAVQVDLSSFGLNLYFTSYCDLATALQSKDNQQRLAPLVQQALAVRLLEAVVSSPNITQLTTRPDVQADAMNALLHTQAKLYGGKVAGTDIVYPSALKSVLLDLSGLDSECGPPMYSPLSIGRLVRH